MKTTLIIPAYYVDDSFVEMTQRCVDSLEFGRPDEVLVIDDGSPVLTGAPYGTTRNIRRTTNGGFAAAVNTGLGYAKGDILIIANNDITFTPGWLEGILKPLEMGYDIVSIRTTDSDGYLTEEKITEGDKFGSLWAMKRAVYERIGGLDERFGRGTFEDTDFRRRATLAGFRIAKNHASVVEHTGRATFDVVDPTQENFKHNREIYKAKWGEVD